MGRAGDSEHQDSNKVVASTAAGLTLTFSIVFSGVALLIYVVLRNEPFRDDISPQIIRVFLSVVFGWGTYALPGEIKYGYKGQRQTITATSAAAVALAFYFGTPTIVPSLQHSNVRQRPPEVIPTRVWAPSNYLTEFSENDDLKNSRTGWLQELLVPWTRDDSKRGKLMVIESERFPLPYRSFNGLVRTVASNNRFDGHKVVAFLISEDKGNKAFIPLVTFYSITESEQRAVIEVPESRKDDYLLILLMLRTHEQYFDGNSFQFQLHRF